MEVKVGETGGLAADGICSILLSYYYRGTTQEVTGSNNTVLSHNEHRAGTLTLTINEVDTFYEGTAHIDEQRHKLCLVDIVGRELTEVHTTLQQLISYLTEIVDLGNSHNSIAA